MAQARRIIENAAFGPDALKLIWQAFDEAWQVIAGNYGTASAIEAGRLQLATIVLTAARDGGRDVAQIKEVALRAMSLSK